MRAARDAVEVPVAVLRTWGVRGVGRRAWYEVTKRTGRLRAAEDEWLARPPATEPLRRAGVVAPPPAQTSRSAVDVGVVRLYGALDAQVGDPPGWLRHPLTGHRFDPSVHWSELSDASPEMGDIKDVWEISRLGWLLPHVRQGAADDDDADGVWRAVESWVEQNPPYRGPNWMCGQETSLRAIAAMFLADALRDSPASTDGRRALVAGLVDRSVGRVVPTLGYALSQRNNHAISEAGFLWTATILSPSLPGARDLRRRADGALVEAVADQFAADGSHSQHSPTYQRLALHVLLWCLLVSRSTGVAPPRGVEDAVRRSVPFLRSLVAPGSDGRVPNLGGNDGALLFDLAPTVRGDLRPLIAHAAAATGQPSGLDPGPWDEEARWFGLEPITGEPVPAPMTSTTHALTRGTAHGVMRAGPVGHKPAHADQLHLDVWLAGEPVAFDAGSYRYTAPAPWGNALAHEQVHNLPRRAETPQAQRSGRFFWRRWSEAEVTMRFERDDLAVVVATLPLESGPPLRRLVAVREGAVVVVDQTGGDRAEVRWNLPDAVEVDLGDSSTVVTGGGWAATFLHGAGAAVPGRSVDEPASGWCAPSYGTLEPATPLLLPTAASGYVVSCFAAGTVPVEPDPGLTALDLARPDVRLLASALAP